MAHAASVSTAVDKVGASFIAQQSAAARRQYVDLMKGG